MNVAKQLKAEHFPKLMGDKFDSPRLHEHHKQIHIIEITRSIGNISNSVSYVEKFILPLLYLGLYSLQFLFLRTFEVSLWKHQK